MGMVDIMSIPDKEEISRLSAAIMRRVEFEQCIHASSIEDEIGKWVREYLEPKKTIHVGADFGVSPATVKPDWVAWSTYAEKMADKVATGNALAAENQRRAQALAQQKFNQQIADNYGGLVAPSYENPLRTDAVAPGPQKPEPVWSEKPEYILATRGYLQTLVDKKMLDVGLPLWKYPRGWKFITVDGKKYRVNE